MKIDRQIAAVMLVMSICVPAVKADLILDPKDVNKLKTLTNGRTKKKEARSSIAPQPNKDKELNGVVAPSKDKELNGAVSQPKKDKELNGAVPRPKKDKELNGITKTDTLKLKSAGITEVKTASKAKVK